MALRQHLVEVSIALLIAACIFVFYDSPSVEHSAPQNSPFNIFNVAERSPAVKKLHMKRLQNCSDTTASQYNVSFINSTSGNASWYLVNASTACAPTPIANSATAVSPVVPFPFVTKTLYVLVMNLDCATGVQTIINRIARIMLIQPGQIVLSSSSCGSLQMVFSCGSAASSADADELCNSIVNNACKPGSDLNKEVAGTSCGTYQSSGGGSSTSLYALFALMAIPILCCFCVILYFRHRQREADNQYMQDTATFSNVAASPQALGTPEYPPPSATYTYAQEAPVVQPVAQSTYVAPMAYDPAVGYQPVYPTPV